MVFALNNPRRLAMPLEKKKNIQKFTRCIHENTKKSTVVYFFLCSWFLSNHEESVLLNFGTFPILQKIRLNHLISVFWDNFSTITKLFLWNSEKNVLFFISSGRIVYGTTLQLKFRFVKFSKHFLQFLLLYWIYSIKSINLFRFYFGNFAFSKILITAHILCAL